MSRLFPSRSSDQPDHDGDTHVIQITDEAADEVFDALGSRTAREILAALYEKPQTASELAEVADTSLQNVKYHLDKFEDVGLAEPVGTVYSEKGQEMTTYGPTSSPLVVTAGEDDQISSLRDVLKYLFGGVTLLAISSIVLNQILSVRSNQGSGSPPTVTRTDVPETVSDPITRTVSGVITPTPSPIPSDPLSTLSPGILFFAGGAFILLLMIGWYWIWR